jgi:hypothetical protein
MDDITPIRKPEIIGEAGGLVDEGRLTLGIHGEDLIRMRSPDCSGVLRRRVIVEAMRVVPDHRGRGAGGYYLSRRNPRQDLRNWCNSS